MKHKIVCASPYFRNTNNRWFAQDFPEYEWEMYYPMSNSRLASLVGKYNMNRISHIKQSLQVANACRQPSTALAIILDEVLTLWSVNLMPRDLTIPIISWSFNYHTLPRGIRYHLARSAFQKVSRFVVHSSFDRQRYAEYFQLPIEKFDLLLWGMPVPIVDSPRLIEYDYICALGENARDYQTLVAAMRNLPEVRLELVIRPYNLNGLTLPPNVKVHMNVPRSQAMNILYHSRFMVLPLQGAEVSNGHVTIVAAQHLGKAIIATNSAGINDYIHPDKDSEVYSSFDVTALTESIARLWQDSNRCELLGKQGQQFATTHLTSANVKNYLGELLRTYLV